MRLAFLTALIPVARPDTGFEIANAAILAALREAGHDVTAFGFVRPGEVPAAPEQAVVIDAVPIENAAVSALRRLAWLGAALAWRLPVACAKLRLADRGRLSASVRARGPFDAIVLNSVMLPGAIPELLALGPCLLVEHNIEHVSARQNASSAGGALARRLYAREAMLLEAIERGLWRDCAHVWTLAEEDRAALGAGLQDKSGVLPLIAGAPTPAAASPAAPPSYDIGLVGTWSWQPNFVGLDWFLREVCPLLPAETSIAVAGRLPAGLTAPSHPRVALLGRVPDADALLRDCRIVALSSRAGTGVQLKTVQAVGLGLPAVATPLSLRGFARVPENVTLAETPAAFAAALTQRLAAIRAGDPQRLDGAAFLAEQRAALASALETGLARAIRH